MKLNIELTFAKGYIAHPYWPALEKLINVQKESGVNRARAEDKRRRALTDYLASKNMSMDDYRQLEAAASRPFYTWGDVLNEMDGHDPLEIVIPSHQIYGAMAQAASLATSSVRLARPESIRNIIDVADFATGRTAPDGVWERYVTVKAGTGAKLSNQRALRTNPYIANFTARGWVRFSEDITRSEKVLDFLRFVGREIGIGASRKMGWGRFEVMRDRD